MIKLRGEWNSTKAIYNNFLMNKLKFEELSGKVISLYKICEQENLRYSLIYDESIAPKILSFISETNSSLGERIELELEA